MASRYLHNIPPYSETSALEAALEYLLVPLPDYGTGRAPEQPYYQESDTAAYYTTLLTSKHFSNGSWVIIPELREVIDRGVKADLVLSKAHEYIPQSPPHPNHLSGDLPLAQTSKLPPPRYTTIPRLVVEFKNTEGDRLEQALAQLIQALKPRADKRDTKPDRHYYQMFYMVARGPLVAFFSYYSDIYHNILDRQQIPHFRGCVSITETHDHMDQANFSRGILSPADIPLDLLRLNYDDPKHTRITKPDMLQLRADAENYTTPCVFNIGDRSHREAVDKILFYISQNTPRRLKLS
ncbi:hypothetical protein BPOR_1237g00010 [Botrytis porri]|uniref:Uncharacterized protein n=1 Tax=Botrytis porri TaxID=87229 RepID=A0A4Z1K551_9HELO|nr:hypothetical protein BPOR_1237g00010 [Botrytis porri]